MDVPNLTIDSTRKRERERKKNWLSDSIKNYGAPIPEEGEPSDDRLNTKLFKLFDVDCFFQVHLDSKSKFFIRIPSNN